MAMASTEDGDGVSAANMTTFIQDYLKKCTDLSSVTVRELREKYIEKHNLKNLSSENKETFRTLVDIVLQEIHKQDKDVSESEKKENEDQETTNKSKEKKKSQKLMSSEDDSCDIDEYSSPLKYDDTSDAVSNDSDIRRRVNKLKSQLLLSDDTDNENNLSEVETAKLESESDSENDSFLKLEENEEDRDMDCKNQSHNDTDNLTDSGKDTDLDDKVLQKIKQNSSLKRNLPVQNTSSDCDYETGHILNTEYTEKNSANVELSKSEDDSEEPEAISQIRKAIIGNDTDSQMSEGESFDVKAFYKRKTASFKEKSPSVQKLSELSDSESDEVAKERIQKLKSKIARENPTRNSSPKREKNLKRINNKKRQLSSSESESKGTIPRKSPLKSNSIPKKILKKRKIEQKRPAGSEFSSDEENIPLMKFTKETRCITQEMDSDLEVMPLKDTVKQKTRKDDRESDFTDSDSKPLKELTASNEKKKSRKKKVAKEASFKEKKENPKIERLKRCIRTVGLRIVYIKVFENCKSDKQKIEKLLEILQDAGIKGTPTLEKCKSLRKKRETAKELDELDTSNIINREGRSCRSKATRRPTEDKTTVESFKPKFPRLKDIVDSEESD